jgi:acylpyruvate hydrolase
LDKIICIGKNYREHAKELGEQQPDLPVMFLKPPSVLRQASAWGSKITADFPKDQEVVPECELVFEIAKNGYQISEVSAISFIRRITVGLDMTLRSLQRQLKSKGHPWTTSKVFPDAALIGPWVEAESFSQWRSLPFGMRSQGQIWQQATAEQMIHNPFFLIHYVSQYFPLCAGDIIFTGTPAGCRSIQAGAEVDLYLGEQSYHISFSSRG